ncbi:MAG: CsbD family protein, partial [Actinobacteria bacterium]|nr:CsbD family protein [Actinomycetota bacterium]
GDESTEAEGRGEQAKANVKQAGEKVKDAAKDVFGK